MRVAREQTQPGSFSRESKEPGNKVENHTKNCQVSPGSGFRVRVGPFDFQRARESFENKFVQQTNQGKIHARENSG